jgi:hypothetical protein
MNYLLTSITRMQSRSAIEDEERRYKIIIDATASKSKDSMVSLAAADLRLSKPKISRTILTRKFMSENKVS